MSETTQVPEDAARPIPPTFEPDPDVIDDLEGNRWTRSSYQKAARAEREKAAEA